MSFLKRTKRIVLFFRRKRKELKESITHPRPSLKGGMQPLLLVALSLRYARGIKAPAWIQRLRVASRLAIYGSPRRGTGFASHTKTLMKEVFLRNQLKPLCRGLGVAIFFGSFSSVVRRNEQTLLVLFKKDIFHRRKEVNFGIKGGCPFFLLNIWKFGKMCVNLHQIS